MFVLLESIMFDDGTHKSCQAWLICLPVYETWLKYNIWLNPAAPKVNASIVRQKLAKKVMTPFYAEFENAEIDVKAH